MSIFIDKVARYHGERRITLKGDRNLSDNEQIDGTIVFEGILAADAVVRFREQVGGYWFIRNATSGGRTVLVRGQSGSIIAVQPAATVLCLYLRQIGFVLCQSDAVSFRGQPYNSVSALNGQSMRYYGSQWVADHPRRTVRYDSNAAVTVAVTDDYLVCTGSLTADVNVALPNVALLGDGRVFTIADGSDNANVHPIFVNPYGSNDIDTGPNFELNIRRSSVTLISRSGGWDILSTKGL